ncbi:MAG TPA: type 1 glutamine amidotransferase domain-containing protein [Candidatus Binatia bacterium]
MLGSLSGMKIAILVTDGFEQSELTEPKKALEKAGAEALIISSAGKQVRSWKQKEWGDSFPVDMSLDAAQPSDYAALLLPGGVMNPDHLRWNPRAVAFVKAFVEANKPIAAICHGPWTLIEAGAVRKRKMTSWPSLRTDLTNAGADWVDEEVVVDGGLVTSRKPDDIPAFNNKMIELFARAEEPRRASA